MAIYLRVRRTPQPRNVTIFYRVVSLAEFRDIQSQQKFRQGPNSMEGKHLTGSIKEAEAFAAMLYPVEPYKIVKVSISRRRSMGFFELGNMDNCGRVWFAELKQLAGAIIREAKQ